MAWPTAMPSEPLASASSRSMSMRRAAPTVSRSHDAMCANASACSASPRENGRRFVELAVTRRTPAAQVVVVHRREIVVNERVRVDQPRPQRRRRRARRAACRTRVRSRRRARGECVCPARARRSASPRGARAGSASAPGSARSSAPSTCAWNSASVCSSDIGFNRQLRRRAARASRVLRRPSSAS